MRGLTYQTLSTHNSPAIFTEEWCERLPMRDLTYQTLSTYNSLAIFTSLNVVGSLRWLTYIHRRPVYLQATTEELAVWHLICWGTGVTFTTAGHLRCFRDAYKTPDLLTYYHTWHQRQWHEYHSRLETDCLIRRCYHGPHLHLPPEKWHRHCPTHWSLVLLTYKINGEVVVLLILHTAIVTIAFCQLVFNKRLSIYLSIYLSVYLSIYLSRKNQGTYWYKHKHHVGIWH